MAFQAYVKVTGKSQGAFKGESLKSSRKGIWSEIKDYEQKSTTPVDAKSGLPKGACTLFPLRITKERGPSSPQFIQAHWTGEMLTEVVIEFVGRPESGAGEAVVERITLNNVYISEFSRFAARDSNEHAEHDSDHLEEVALVGGTIKVENIAASTSTSFDWNANDK